jgi:hypothetical protein
MASNSTFAGPRVLYRFDFPLNLDQIIRFFLLQLGRDAGIMDGELRMQVICENDDCFLELAKLGFQLHFRKETVGVAIKEASEGPRVAIPLLKRLSCGL